MTPLFNFYKTPITVGNCHLFPTHPPYPTLLNLCVSPPSLNPPPLSPPLPPLNGSDGSPHKWERGRANAGWGWVGRKNLKKGVPIIPLTLNFIFFHANHTLVTNISDICYFCSGRSPRLLWPQGSKIINPSVILILFF